MTRITVKSFFYLTTILTSLNFNFGLELTPVIVTHNGPIQGAVKKTVQNMTYWAFESVPYAKPPVGYRRFKPPEELDHWKDVKETVKEPTACPQYDDDEGGIIGQEDCLYLNVYTPKINKSDSVLRAVMVWIYGGAFRIGYVSYFGPDFLLEENIVIVAVSYRLGALGFLHVEHKNATGNAALKDQRLALKWVQKNIKEFGGDPKKVTIFGQSAGSVAVQLHMLSDSSQGLFSRAISSSGSPLNFWGFSKPFEAAVRAYTLGRQLGIYAYTPETLLTELYKKSAEEIINATTQMFQLDLPFKPTIEPDDAPEAFFTSCTVSKYRNGNFSQIPVIIGFCHSETVTFATTFTEFQKAVNSALGGIGNSSLLQNLEDVKLLKTLAKQFNKTTGNIDDVTTESLYKLVRITTDLLMISDIDKTQKYLVEHNKAPVYYYRNSFDYEYSLHKVNGFNPLNGTGHSDDNAHIFWISNKSQPLDPNSDIGLQRRRMCRMWTNFAKYGNPTPGNETDPLLGVIWPNSTDEGLHLEINNTLSVEPRPIDILTEVSQGAADIFRGVENGCSIFGSLSEDHANYESKQTSSDASSIKLIEHIL